MTTYQNGKAYSTGSFAADLKLNQKKRNQLITIHSPSQQRVSPSYEIHFTPQVAEK